MSDDRIRQAEHDQDELRAMRERCRADLHDWTEVVTHSLTSGRAHFGDNPREQGKTSLYVRDATRVGVGPDRWQEEIAGRACRACGVVELYLASAPLRRASGEDT